MSVLREAAEEALRNKRAREAAEAAVIAENVARAGVKRACDSPLGQWFPTVAWKFVANLTDGTTLVRAMDDLDVLLGVKVVNDGAVDQGPDEWEVAVYAREAGIFGVGSGFRRIERLENAAALGEYLERTTPQPDDDEDVPA